MRQEDVGQICLGITQKGFSTETRTIVYVKRSKVSCDGWEGLQSIAYTEEIE